MSLLVVEALSQYIDNISMGIQAGAVERLRLLVICF